MHSDRSAKEFDNLFLNSIDDAFCSLGERAKNSLYLHLEDDFFLAREEIPNRVEEFIKALEKIFGAAALQLELLIMQSLHQKTNCSHEWVGPKWLVPELSFKDYINMSRLAFTDSGSRGNLEVIVNQQEILRRRI